MGVTMSCEIDNDYGETPSICDSKMQIARKPHKCCECGQVISQGQKYERFRGMWNGKFDTFKTCQTCLDIRSEFFCTYVFGQIFDDLHEYINDCGGDVPEEKLNNLGDDARGIVIMMIDDYLAV
jgi:hypothetical protein